MRPGVPSWRVLFAFARQYDLPSPALRSEVAHAAQRNLRRRYYAQGEAATIEIEVERAELLRQPHSR